MQAACSQALVGAAPHAEPACILQTLHNTCSRQYMGFELTFTISYVNLWFVKHLSRVCPERLIMPAAWGSCAAGCVPAGCQWRGDCGEVPWPQILLGGHQHLHNKVSPAKELAEVGNSEKQNLEFPKPSEFPLIHLLVPKQRYDFVTGVCKKRECSFTPVMRGTKLGLLLGMLQAGTRN